MAFHKLPPCTSNPDHLSSNQIQNAPPPQGTNADRGRFNTKPRIGQVRERIWQFQNKESRGSWRPSSFSISNLVKGASTKRDVNDFKTEEVRPGRALVHDKEIKGIQLQRNTAAENVPKVCKSTSSRMILDKIWGHRSKKESIGSQGKRDSESDVQDPFSTGSKNLQDQPWNRVPPHPHVSYNFKESLIWDRLSRDSATHRFSPQNSPERGLIQETSQFLFSSSPNHRRTDERVRKHHDRHRFTQRGHRHGQYHDDRSYKSSVDHGQERSIGHSQLTTQVSDRLSSLNAQHSQSISDKHHSESVEGEDPVVPRRSSRWQSELRSSSPRDHFLGHDDRYNSRGFSKENSNPNVIRYTHHHQTASHAINPPSFRQFRKVRENTDEIRSGRFYKNSSHTTSSSNKKSSRGHHRRKPKHRSSRGEYPVQWYSVAVR